MVAFEHPHPHGARAPTAHLELPFFDDTHRALANQLVVWAREQRVDETDDRAAFEAVFAQDGVDPPRAAMFEDDPRNLAVPHALGMRTVHVAPAPVTAPHIQHHTADLSGFLSQLLA